MLRCAAKEIISAQSACQYMRARHALYATLRWLQQRAMRGDVVLRRGADEARHGAVFALRRSAIHAVIAATLDAAADVSPRALIDAATRYICCWPPAAMALTSLQHAFD